MIHLDNTAIRPFENVENDHYVIVRSRTFYNQRRDSKTLEQHYYTGDALVFVSRAEARAPWRELDQGIYRQAHNEYGRPAYAITRVKFLPNYLRCQVQHPSTY